MIEPSTSGSPENHDALPSRRALRAQREAEEARRIEPTTEVTVARQIVVPAVTAVTPTPTPVSIQVPLPTAAQVPLVRPRTRRPEPRVVVAAAAPASIRSPRSKRKNPLTTAFTLIAIPALFLTTALPAYAFSPGRGNSLDASSEHDRATAGAQGLEVSAGAAHVSVSRDNFTATSQEELTQRTLDAKRTAAIEAARASAAEFAVRGVRAEGDDYPWPYEATDGQGGGLSPLGYYYRECVDFVAWRLNRDAGATSGGWRWTWNSMTPGGGNASSWAGAWEGHGWATSNTPIAGAVAWFNYNHVAYVQSVGADGSVVLEEYNWMGSHAYHTRTVAPSDVALYLYPPV